MRSTGRQSGSSPSVPGAVAAAAAMAVLLLALASLAETPLSDPYDILSRHFDAMGGLENLKSIKTRYYEADITFMGMQGTVKAWKEVPARERNEMSLGVLQMTSGDNGETSWMVDPNGKIQIIKDEVSLKRRQVEALLEAYEYANPESEYFTAALDGIEKVGETECYVIRLTNSIDDDVRLRYFDTGSFLQLKAVDPQMSFEVYTLFSDYRQVDGIKLPFHREAEIQPLGQKQIIQITKYELGVTMDPALFEPPQQDAQDFTFDNGATEAAVPFDYVLDHIYVDATVAGVPSRWVLDTGASATVVDSTFAAEIGLPAVGKAKAIGAGGTVDIDLVTLPAFRIHGITIDEQRVGSTPVRSLFARRGIEIAGILGYDFLSRFVTRIDYAGETISFYHPESFHYDGDGDIIDAPLSHRLFGLPMTVDGVYGGTWALDIGASITTFRYPFAEEHGLLEKQGVERLMGGAGGHLHAKICEFDSARIGRYTLREPLILVPLENLGALSFEHGPGVIGNNMLRRFVLYLDYGNQRIILEKGSDFETDFPKDRSGLNIVLSPEGGYEVLFVSAGTPAEEAGFLKGDIVKSINGIAVENLGDPVVVSNLFREAAGTVYEIEIERNGGRQKLTLTLGDLY